MSALNLTVPRNVGPSDNTRGRNSRSAGSISSNGKSFISWYKGFPISKVVSASPVKSRTINITTDKATTFSVKLIDLSGKTIRNMSQAAARGVSQVTLRDVEKLPAGIYMLEVTDVNAATRTVHKLIKN